jgi:NADPH:quinone reductase-like Zn-dependent oxidoreductase
MKAMIHARYGPPEHLRMGELADPVPDPRQLLVRVHAHTVNRTDCGYLLAQPWVIRPFSGIFKPRSPVLGIDFAGEVLAVGAQASGFRVGDRVWGINDNGLRSHAELLVIDADGPVVKIPEGFSYVEAAASAEGAHYALNFVRFMAVKPGERVLVIGGTGAIGSAMIQLLVGVGAQVIAVCDSRGGSVVRELGASAFIDHTQEDFTKTGHAPFHYVMDAVGKSRFRLCEHLLLPGGTYLSSELGPGAENLYLPFFTRFRKDKKRSRFCIPLNCKRSLLELNQWIADGKFKPLVDRCYPFEAIPEAFSYVLEGQKMGNVVITRQVP